MASPFSSTPPILQHQSAQLLAAFWTSASRIVTNDLLAIHAPIRKLTV